MTSTVHHPAPTARDALDDVYTARLRGLTGEQLLEAMTFLAWWSPGIFTAVLDYCEFGNWGADFRARAPKAG
jgi:hypothetical protein